MLKTNWALAGLIVAFSCLIFNVNAQTRDQGIGLRVGDPLGVTYKSYFNKVNALELIVGSTSANWHRSYYKNNFDNRDKYSGFQYVDHSINYTLAF